MSNKTLAAGRPSSKKDTATLNDLTGLQEPVRLNFDLERSDRSKLRVYAAQHETTVSALLREAVKSILKDV